MRNKAPRARTIIIAFSSVADESLQFVDRVDLPGLNPRRLRLAALAEIGVQRHARRGVEPDALPGPAGDHKCDVPPMAPFIDRFGPSLHEPSLGIGVMAQLANKHAGVRINARCSLAPASKPRKDFGSHCRKAPIAA